MKRVMIGTAGHIDHGKTSLVGRLTGVDPTRHPEERERGMSIDIGFAPLFVEADLVAGIVDVPGHERFIRNMVAGATGIDCVLLVVAADDGVMPQTREHLQILELLGIREGLVALTKIDMAGPEGTELAREDVREFLKGTFLESAPILPVSNTTGDGIEALRSELRRLALAVPSKSLGGVFRLPVQRVFVREGFGTIVTGIPFSGSIRAGDPIEVVPGHKAGRVRGIQAYGREAPEAQAGHSVSLNLAEIPHGEIRRGDVVATPGYLRAVTRLEARLRFSGGEAPKRNVLQDLTSVRVLVGTAESCGRVALVGKEALALGEEAFVQLRLEAPIVAVPGDRFILRLESPLVTLGGGLVVDISDRRLRRLRQGLPAELERKESALGDVRARVAAALLSERAPVGAAQLSRAAMVEPETLLGILADLARNKSARPVGKNWIGEGRWSEARGQLLDALRVFHQTNPSQVGAERAALRESARLEPELFGALVSEALASRVLREAEGGRLSLPGHVPRLSGAAGEKVSGLEACFRSAGFSPPSAEEAFARIGFPEKEGKEAVRLLVQKGILVPVGEGILFHREHVERARELLVRTAESQGEVVSGAFRDALKTSRKYVIPLLEHFDAQGLTKRVGSKRFLRKFSR